MADIIIFTGEFILLVIFLTCTGFICYRKGVMDACKKCMDIVNEENAKLIQIIKEKQDNFNEEQ